MSDEDDDVFTFPPENMFQVLDHMKGCSPVLETCDTQELCELYTKLFPMQDGLYEISEPYVTALNTAIINKTLLELVKKDLVTMLWDDETNGFSFQITEKGKWVVDNTGEEK